MSVYVCVSVSVCVSACVSMCISCVPVYPVYLYVVCGPVQAFFACVLPHLYSGVSVMQVCNVCVHLEYQMGTHPWRHDTCTESLVHKFT